MKTWEIWKTNGRGETVILPQDHSQREKLIYSTLDGSKMELVESFETDDMQQAYQRFDKFLERLDSEKKAS